MLMQNFGVTKSIWYVKVFQEWSRIVVKISYSVSSHFTNISNMTSKKSEVTRRLKSLWNDSEKKETFLNK